jgi:hypothetical protein
MTVILEKNIRETDAITGFLDYIDSYDPELFVTHPFSTEPGANSYIVEVRLSTLKLIADRLRQLQNEDT